MLKNYFKLAIKVLGRKKFFTFISLFGISFTLMILMLVTSFLETEFGNYAPLSQKDKMVFIPSVVLKRIVTDTIPEVDSVRLDGRMVYDTTFSYNERQSSMSSSNAGWPLLDKYLRAVQKVENYSFYATGSWFDIFLNSNKLTFKASYTDAAFWQIFDFEFIEGRAYGPQQVERQEQVAVITTKASRQHFGRESNVVGEELILENKHYKVIGLVETISNRDGSLSAEVYIPLSNINPKDFEDESFLGSFSAVFLAEDPASIPLIHADIDRIAQTIPLPASEARRFNTLEIRSFSFFERYATDFFGEEDATKSVRIFLFVLIALLSLFVMLPTLNLINLNISRIMERSSEIGVRKAFGAHKNNILFQFVFENVILTLIGGIIGLILALILLNTINSSQVLGDTLLRFNFKVFIFSILICVLFGILSGLIPAYKMSKVHIVNALKQNQL